MLHPYVIKETPNTVLSNFTQKVVSNTTHHLKLIAFIQIIIKRYCTGREQATSDFLEELSSLCTYLDPLGFRGVLGNLHQKMKKVLISGTLSRGTCN